MIAEKFSFFVLFLLTREKKKKKRKKASTERIFSLASLAYAREKNNKTKTAVTANDVE